MVAMVTKFEDAKGPTGSLFRRGLAGISGLEAGGFCKKGGGGGGGEPIGLLPQSRMEPFSFVYLRLVYSRPA